MNLTRRGAHSGHLRRPSSVRAGFPAGASALSPHPSGCARGLGSSV